jgi:serine/threonine protein kinase
LLPLPKNIPISVPIAVLKGAAGYVMQLLNEMVPLNDFMSGKPEKENIPDWLSKMPEKEAKEIIYYYETGGAKRRMTALYKTACLLARLHGNGLIYGDISPNNVFISKDLEYSSVYLIDADNIRFEQIKGSGIYTPKYGAPELVNNTDSARPQSDVWAFAVMMFYLLSMTHPFIGKRVENKEDDWAAQENNDDPEIKAYKGEFAFVDDKNDDSNSTDNGLPRVLLFTDKLQELFHKTFSEEGRLKSFTRPTIWNWAVSSVQAADKMIICPECQMSYYYDYEEDCGKNQCPYCGKKRPEIIRFESRFYNNSKMNKQCWEFVVAKNADKNERILVPQRVFGEFLMSNFDDQALEILVKDSKIIFSNNQDEIPIYIATRKNRKFEKLYGKRTEDTKKTNEFWAFAESVNPRIIKIEIFGEK